MSSPEKIISKQTRRGILVLTILCLCIIYTPRFLHWLNPREKLRLTYSETVEGKKLSAYRQQKKIERKNKYPKKKKFRRPPEKFDPNEYTAEQWASLGLSEKQVNVVLKFTKRGIYSNEDLKKIFVIPDVLYELIKDSTYFPEKPAFNSEKDQSTKTNSYKDPSQQKTILVELNTAEQGELEDIPGIGPFLAKMILKKRAELGGFVSKEQILEVYKMDVDKFERIEKYIRVNPDILTPLKINTATFEELYRHPYISSKVANSIVKMREQKGGYKSIDELKESLLIDQELFLKLKPYVYL